MTTTETSTSAAEFDLENISSLEGKTHKEIIETVIASLEENDSAMVSKTDGAYLWKFQYGTVEVFVQLTGESDEDLLTVWSSVLSLPAKNEATMMRQLLEYNWSETFEACFAIVNNQVVVQTQRTVVDLSPSEIARAITLVADTADAQDEPLQENYGL